LRETKKPQGERLRRYSFMKWFTWLNVCDFVAEERDHLRGPQPGEVPVAQEGEVGNRGRISQNMIST
jgi:hypothetical protein